MSILGASILDVAIIAIILISGFMSGLRGFAEELITLISWVISLFVAFQFAEWGVQFIPSSWEMISLGGRDYDLSDFHILVSGILLFLATFILISQLHRVLNPMIEGSMIRRGNRVVGFLFGLVRGSILVLALVLILGTTTIPEAEFWGKSNLIPHFVELSQLVISWLPEDWQAYFNYPQALLPE